MASAVPNPVGYFVADGHWSGQLPQDKAYGYVMAKNGVFKIARNRWFEACIPVKQCRVVGLAEMRPFVRLSEKVPVKLLHRALGIARHAARDVAREVMFHVVWTSSGYKLRVPEQVGTASRLRYTGGDGSNVVLDLHSHCNMRAFFSSTDNADEQGLRLYGVLGRVFAQPEVLLRVGVYGDFWPLRLADVFGGLQ